MVRFMLSLSVPKFAGAPLDIGLIGRSLLSGSDSGDWTIRGAKLLRTKSKGKAP